MFRQMKRITLFALSAILSFSMPLSSLAAGQQIEDAGSADISIVAQGEDNWTVSLPIITFKASGKDKWQMNERYGEMISYQVSGQISPEKQIAVTHGNTFVWKDVNGIKEDVITTIANKKSYYDNVTGSMLLNKQNLFSKYPGKYSNFGGFSYNTSKSAFNDFFTVGYQGLTAGEWEGNMNFHIAVEDASFILNAENSDCLIGCPAKTLIASSYLAPDGNYYKYLYEFTTLPGSASMQDWTWRTWSNIPLALTYIDNKAKLVSYDTEGNTVTIIGNTYCARYTPDGTLYDKSSGVWAPYHDGKYPYYNNDRDILCSNPYPFFTDMASAIEYFAAGDKLTAENKSEVVAITIPAEVTYEGKTKKVRGFTSDFLDVFPNVTEIELEPNEWDIFYTLNNTNPTSKRIINIDCNGMSLTGNIPCNDSAGIAVGVSDYNTLYLTNGVFFDKTKGQLDFTKTLCMQFPYYITSDGGNTVTASSANITDEMIITNEMVPNNTFYAKKLIIEDGAVSRNGVMIYPQNTTDYVNKETFVHAWFSYSGIPSITSVILSENCKGIAANAFKGCSGFTSIVIPEGVEYIGAEAFSGCTKLENITLPSTIKYIGTNAFAGTKFLSNLAIANEKVEINGNVIFEPVLNLSDYVEEDTLRVPAAVTKLYAADVPDGVKNIKFEDGSLCARINLANIAYDSVDLTNTPLLTKLMMNPVNENHYAGGFANVKTIKTGVQNSFTGEILTSYNGTIVLVEGVEQTGNFNHYVNYPGSTFKIPASVKNLGEILTNDLQSTYPGHCFYDMGGGKSVFSAFEVAAGNTVYTTILDGILYNKKTDMIVSVPNYWEAPDGVLELPEGCKGIGELGLSRNKSITKLILPDTYEFIEEMGSIANVNNYDLSSLTAATYLYCGVKEVEVKESNPNYKSIDGCLYTKDGKKLLYVPFDYEGELNITEGCVEIAHNAFMNPETINGQNLYNTGNRNLTTGTCKATVYAGITKITLPSSMTTIPDDQFEVLTTKFTADKVKVAKDNTAFFTRDNNNIGFGEKLIKMVNGSDTTPKMYPKMGYGTYWSNAGKIGLSAEAEEKAVSFYPFYLPAGTYTIESSVEGKYILFWGRKGESDSCYYGGDSKTILCSDGQNGGMNKIKIIVDDTNNIIYLSARICVTNNKNDNITITNEMKQELLDNLIITKLD